MNTLVSISSLTTHIQIHNTNEDLSNQTPADVAAVITLRKRIMDATCMVGRGRRVPDLITKEDIKFDHTCTDGDRKAMLCKNSKSCLAKYLTQQDELNARFIMQSIEETLPVNIKLNLFQDLLAGLSEPVIPYHAHALLLCIAKVPDAVTRCHLLRPVLHFLPRECFNILHNIVNMLHKTQTPIDWCLRTLSPLLFRSRGSKIVSTTSHIMFVGKQLVYVHILRSCHLQNLVHCLTFFVKIYVYSHLRWH